MPLHRAITGNAVDPDATRSSLLGRLKNWEDQSGWQEFFDTYWKLIYSVGIKAGLSDAEAHDLVQETAVSLAKQMPAEGYDRNKGSFKNWLCTITRRRIVDHLRPRKPDERRRSSREPADTSTNTDTIHPLPDPACVELRIDGMRAGGQTTPTWVGPLTL